MDLEQEVIDGVWDSLKITNRESVLNLDSRVLKEVDPDSTPGAFSKEQCLLETESLRLELGILQEKLHAQAKSSVLLILQGLDTAGKDGTIRRVFDGTNPQGVTVSGFKAPTELELSHDFLWRIHSKCPVNGMITIFNRSHYEDLIVPLAYQTLPQEALERRARSIEEFEENLQNNGTRILRVFLHISYREQAERLLSRIDVEKKHWKFSAADLQTRSHWPEFQRAYSAMISRTSDHHRPWHVVPADHKWYRDWAVMSMVVRLLREMAPEYPEVTLPDVDGLRRELLGVIDKAKKHSNGKNSKSTSN
ncbi:MAG: polyphosphate kinase 2 family protein [Acidimicrobiaceae bacterium]|nr:polyphosphate kinase 2 family protein [Acidimicrobiaceae bacterium]